MPSMLLPEKPVLPVNAGAGEPLPAALAGITDVEVLGCDDVNLAAYRASTGGFGIWPVRARFRQCPALRLVLDIQHQHIW